MKPLVLASVLAASAALPALAQDAPASPFQSESAAPAVQASSVIGARIYASESALDADAYPGVQEGWNDIGEVNDIILGRDGTVDAVLVDIGGFLGMGERQVAVDMSALRFIQDDATDADDWFLVLQADRATLEGAPEWMTAPAMDGAAATDPAADPAVTDTAATEGGMALPEGYSAVPPDALTAEMLTGANVRDVNDTSIAEVSDLVLTEDGRVTHVVLDVGGFLGIGSKSVALPIESLTIAKGEDDRVSVWANATKAELEAMPDHAM